MATKLECFILHRSEVVLTLALLYSHAHSTEKHIFHRFLTRQIAHWKHRSALVILILFTPIKKRTVKHSGDESQRSRAWCPGRCWAGQWVSLSWCKECKELHANTDTHPGPPKWGKQISLALLIRSYQLHHCCAGAVLLPLCPAVQCAVQWRDFAFLQWKDSLKRAQGLVWNFSLLSDGYKKLLNS